MAEKERPGCILKQTRESKGITLGMVHEETKIPIDALRAIEEGYTVRMLSPFYQKGFIKIYAKFLDVDLKEVRENVDEEPNKEQPILPKEEKKQEDPMKLTRSFLTPDIAQLLFKIFVFLMAGFLVLKLGGFVIHKISAKKPSSFVQKKEEQVREKKNVNKSRSVRSSREKTNASPAVEAPTSRAKKVKEGINTNIILTARARKNSWLQVRVDGITVFQSVFKAGVVETWSAKEAIELTGKNINTLEFELNGKMIGSLGRQSRKVKRVIVTKDGLSVKD